MKLSIAASLLLVPLTDAFTPSAFHSRAPLKNPSSSALGYVEDQAEGAEVLTPAQVDLSSVLLKEDPATAALAESLEVADNTVRNEYANWLMRYGKTTELSHYPTFKKNFLLQEEHNSNFVGQCSSLKSFSLNEYGDCTEGASPRLSFSPFCLLFVSRFGFVSRRGVRSNQGNSSRKGRISSSN
jgi:hypothetical protein